MVSPHGDRGSGIVRIAAVAAGLPQCVAGVLLFAEAYPGGRRGLADRARESPQAYGERPALPEGWPAAVSGR
ncbi:hypothetical protein [Streptomyces sp. NRRL F-2890]|uniref:hypothetical protein n=1 Tax=Streptomyces sp. NRRL F-2890 TaxID=1463845 RepID=UPI0004CC0676|nr:hypothetical protein [Streptomyces sp. NRRL F-2890]